MCYKVSLLYSWTALIRYYWCCLYRCIAGVAHTGPTLLSFMYCIIIMCIYSYIHTYNVQSVHTCRYTYNGSV